MCRWLMADGWMAEKNIKIFEFGIWFLKNWLFTPIAIVWKMGAAALGVCCANDDVADDYGRLSGDLSKEKSYPWRSTSRMASSRLSVVTSYDDYNRGMRMGAAGPKKTFR